MVIVEGKDERCLGKKVEGEKKTFVDVAKEPAGRQGDALWLQVGGRGLRNREEGLGRCLVERWDDGSVVETEMVLVRKWGERSWNLKKGMKVLKLGGPFMLLEFEDEEEAERVLKRGTRRFKDKVLQLERWSEEAGCLQVGSQAKEVWVRVVGISLHCWNEDMFKRIGDYCGGFVEVDETKNLPQFQWARILVKNRGNFFPRTLHLVVDSYCYALQFWWERLPWISVVVLMKKLKGGEGEKVREEWDVGSRAGSSSSKGREKWCVVEAGGAGLIRKVGGRKSVMETGRQVQLKNFQPVRRRLEKKGVEGWA